MGDGGVWWGEGRWRAVGWVMVGDGGGLWGEGRWGAVGG